MGRYESIALSGILSIVTALMVAALLFLLLEHLEVQAAAGTARWFFVSGAALVTGLGTFIGVFKALVREEE